MQKKKIQIRMAKIFYEIQLEGNKTMHELAHESTHICVLSYSSSEQKDVNIQMRVVYVLIAILFRTFIYTFQQR